MTTEPYIQMVGAIVRKVKSIGDENCLENSRAVKRLEGSTPLPSAKYNGRCSKMVLTPVWKTGDWHTLVGVRFLLLPPSLG